ncbi:MAG: glycosyltransferase family 4 protein [Chloroflexi bacterium]|nr:glycosyltransferase family 4 protein [Chloroflexota bacterium]
MNIVVCHIQVPYVSGGAEVLRDGLLGALQAEGHQVELVQMPFKWYPRANLERQALAWRMLDLERVNGRTVDLVICTKFPTWLVRHPRKVVWLVHQHRPAYDWYGTEFSDFNLSDEDRRARRLVFEADGLGLTEASAIFTISKNVAQRLLRYNGLPGTPLYPPTAHNLFHNTAYGDYLFFIGRIDRAKRLDLLLEALCLTKTNVRAIIAGTGTETERLKARVKALGLSGRVEFPGRVSDSEAVELYAGALAVYYAPDDEDYGYVTIEAMRSQKAVLTAPDSGGVLEFVRDGENGFICDSPVAFATAIDRLYVDRNLAARLGNVGLSTVATVPAWSEVAQRLTRLD